MECCVSLAHVLDTSLRIFEGWWHRRHSIQSCGTRTATGMRCICTAMATRGTGTSTGWTTIATLSTPRLFSQLSSYSRPQVYFFGAVEFFTNCPFQPPSILPMALIFSEIAMYCLSLSEFDSQRTMSIILIVSVLRMARCTKGSFSCGFKKEAVAVASIASTKSVSTRKPSECRCVLGRIW